MKVERLVSLTSFGRLAVEILQARCDAALNERVVPSDQNLSARIAVLRANPAAEERCLIALADRLGLDNAELLAIALCLAADNDAHIARLVARAQEPVGGSRPLVGLLTSIAGAAGLTPLTLAGSKAVHAGVLVFGEENAALPERSVHVPVAVAAALDGLFSPPVGISEIRSVATPLAARDVMRAADEAQWLFDDTLPVRMLVARTACRREAQAIASAIADAGQRIVVELSPEDIARHAVWLMATEALPCIRVSLGPGDTFLLPNIGTYTGPVLCLSGNDGAVESQCAVRDWLITMPDEDNRANLWHDAGLDITTARRAAQNYRQGAGRIAELADRARLANRSGEIDWPSLSNAVRNSRSPLDGLARKIAADVSRTDLVLPPNALADLDRLVARVQHRSRLADGLGPAVAVRYRPGVRALFTGDSGTGKTLAAHWLAGQTGLPLYRVDQAALTSKWIGETEKNLSAVLDAAQHADVVLFFDEADALFGARTDVSDSNDRHANAQTNYLLQRIEEYEGVAILATNSRDRFDPAFVRRLDIILPFPMPDAKARLDIWHVHLGGGQNLTDDEIGTISFHVDLAGGHVRNIVLAAAVRARIGQRRIDKSDIIAAVADEYGKLGRAPPAITS
jgi:hypothetical protein